MPVENRDTAFVRPSIREPLALLAILAISAWVAYIYTVWVAFVVAAAAVVLWRGLSRPSRIAALTAVLFLVAIAVAVEWRAHRERQVVRAILRSGGIVEFTPIVSDRVYNVMSPLVGEEYVGFVSELNFDRADERGEEFAPDCDAVLSSVWAPHNIREISLRFHSVDEKALFTLTRFTGLEVLLLDHNSGVTDQLIRELATLWELERLGLIGTRVSDGCVDDLVKMPTLREIYLTETNISDEGVERLKRLRPDIKVWR